MWRGASSLSRSTGKEERQMKGKFMLRRNMSTVLVATALATLLLIAFSLSLAQDELPTLALDLTEHLFGIVLAVFVFERVLDWREERRWLAAKEWLYMTLLEEIDALLEQLLPASVPMEETAGEVTVYEVTGGRVQFGEVKTYGLLRLLVKPDDKDLQAHVLWYIKELGPVQYVSLAKAALSRTQEQIRETFRSSARLMEADITTMLMSFEQSSVAALGHVDSALTMREKMLEEVPHLYDEESAEYRAREADYELAFATSMIVESVVDSAMKPKAWLEERIHGREGELPFQRLRAGNQAGLDPLRRN